MDIKQGYKTTEFWVTIGSMAVTVAGFAGVFAPGDVEGVNNAVGQLVTAVFSGVAAVAYIVGRVQLKKE